LHPIPLHNSSNSKGYANGLVWVNRRVLTSTGEAVEKIIINQQIWFRKLLTRSDKYLK
jgi:hypothetical protein